MPGLACYDYGDTIRFAACTAAEDQPEGMKLDQKLFRAYTEGYLSETAGFLTEAELASRFLGDYLIGDKYFRIDYPEQNLRRAQAQLALFKDMMLHMDEMRQSIREIAKRADEYVKIYQQ